jgi:hypothetical protein
MVGGGLLSAAAALALGLFVARRRNLSLTDVVVRLRPTPRYQA